MNRIWLLTILTLGLMIIFGNWDSLFSEQREIGEKKVIGQERPDYTMEDLLLRDFGGEGELNHQIRAERIDHYDSDDRLEIQLPQLSAYEAGKLIIEVKSDSAVVHKNPSVLLMQGLAHLTQKQPPQISITTRNLFIYPDKGVAESQQRTKIQSQGLILQSGSFLYRYTQGQLELGQGVDGNIRSSSGGTSLLKGNTLTFRYQNQQPQKLTLLGSPATVEYQHPLQPMLGQARKIQYDFHQQVLILEGDARLQQGSQSFRGESLRFDLKQNKVVTGGTDKGQPPVKFIIQQPEKKSTP